MCVMADSSPSTPEPGGPTTRQLLDELDALMQRMLALPVETLEEPPPVPPRSAELVTPLPEEPVVPLLVDQVPMQEDFTPIIVAPPVPETPPVTPSSPPLLPVLLPLPPTAAVVQQEPIAKKPSQEPRVAKPKSEPVAGKPKQEPAAAKPRPVWLKTAPEGRPPAPPAATGAVMNALLAFNRGFDRGTTLLGPPGRWLRGEQGRSLLGWMGLAMLGAAVVWAVLRFLG
jgi:hypothetical protein